jgi:hypothetical protein
MIFIALADLNSAHFMSLEQQFPGKFSGASGGGSRLGG